MSLFSWKIQQPHYRLDNTCIDNCIKARDGITTSLGLHRFDVAQQTHEFEFNIPCQAPGERW